MSEQARLIVVFLLVIDALTEELAVYPVEVVVRVLVAVSVRLVSHHLAGVNPCLFVNLPEHRQSVSADTDGVVVEHLRQSRPLFIVPWQ